MMISWTSLYREAFLLRTISIIPTYIILVYFLLKTTIKQTPLRKMTAVSLQYPYEDQALRIKKLFVIYCFTQKTKQLYLSTSENTFYPYWPSSLIFLFCDDVNIFTCVVSDTMYFLFIYLIYPKTGRAHPQSRSSNNGFPAWVVKYIEILYTKS